MVDPSQCSIGKFSKGWYCCFPPITGQYLRKNGKWCTCVRGGNMPDGWFDTLEELLKVLETADPVPTIDPSELRSDISPDVAPLIWKNGKRCAPDGCYIDDNGNIIRDAKPMLIRETRGFWARNWPVWVGLVLGSVLGYLFAMVLKGAWAACG